MSSVTIILIIFINYFYYIITSNQCNLLSAIDLQSATYSHSLILRVQPLNSKNLITSEVLVREVIKISKLNTSPIKINEMIIIQIEKDLDELLDHSCWHLLHLTNIDIILFLNETNTNAFDLHYPPVESTFRVRENIDAVMDYETYSPQVIIKTRITKPILSNSYSLQCNARGNPLPRLLWSKNNQTLEYYPTARQCQTSCRIYSIQNKYQSVLYFRSLATTDSGIYVCHAENAINHTMVSVYINIDKRKRNMTCASLKSCHHRGQCLIVNNQLKCLCDNRYFGEQCETNYDEIIKKQNNTILLFKSRFLTACILFLIGFIVILITFISCLLARNKATKREEISSSKSMTNGKIGQINQRPLSSLVVEKVTDDGDDDRMSKNMNKTEIRSLTRRTDRPKHYTKSSSFPNRFFLPRSVNQE